MSKATQDTMLKQLKNPFDPKFVKWRIGSTTKDKSKGQAVAYIDAREVKKRLDDVCGLGGWQSKYVPLDKGFICELSILVDGTWITKSDAAGMTQIEAVKGGASDALKRAASTWGIGRYLYYLPSPWVAIEPMGKSYKLSVVPELPKWALPGEVERWEDVAEMEADMNSGEDVSTNADAVTVESALENIKQAPDVTSVKAIMSSLDQDMQLQVAEAAELRVKELSE